MGRQCGSMWADGNKVCVGVCLWADSVGVCRQTCNVGVCLWEDRGCGSMFVDRKVVWEDVFGQTCRVYMFVGTQVVWEYVCGQTGGKLWVGVCL